MPKQSLSFVDDFRNTVCIAADIETTGGILDATALEVEVFDGSDSIHDDCLDADETDRIILQVIDSMPPRRREVFCMSRYEYMTAKEIAERTGLSARTVEKHIELALRQLRDALRHDSE